MIHTPYFQFVSKAGIFSLCLTWQLGETDKQWLQFCGCNCRFAKIVQPYSLKQHITDLKMLNNIKLCLSNSISLFELLINIPRATSWLEATFMSSNILFVINNYFYKSYSHKSNKITNLIPSIYFYRIILRNMSH